MVTWKVTELSKLAKVTVATLHHYDQIGLLKPSRRLPNGYRVYTERDLLALQQIIALKYYGLSLKRIQEIMAGQKDMRGQLIMQRKLIQAQVKELQDALKNLDLLINDLDQNRAIDWNKILELIEVYRVVEKLKKSWAAEVYTPEQLKQFAELGQQYSEKEIVAYQDRWKELIRRVEQNLDKDPQSAVGRKLGKEWMNLVNNVYGKKPALKRAIYSVYKRAQIPNLPFSKTVFEWIEAAIKRPRKRGTHE